MKQILFVLLFTYCITATAQPSIQAWTARYSNVVDSRDDATKLVVDPAGNVIVVGFTDDGVGGANLLLIKYSNPGTALWTNRFTGPGNGQQQPSVAVDGAGNLFVLCTSLGASGDADLVTLKYSGAGIALWTNRYNGLGGNNAQAAGLALDSNTNVIAVGSTYGIGTSLDFCTLKYSNAGIPLWTNRYNGTGNGGDIATAVTVDSSGNVFVAGISDSPSVSIDFTTVAYNSGGAFLWANRYHASGNDDEAYAIASTGGRVFVTGYTTAANGNFDFLTIAYSTAGSALWTNRYNGPGNRDDQAVALAVSSSNVFVTGFSYATASSDDFTTIAYSTNGTALWTNRYNGPANTFDRATAITVGAAGQPYVTGFSSGSTSGLDYTTIAYSTLGTVQWLTRFTRSGAHDDNSQAIAVDANGNVFVSGSTDTGTSLDWATLKYSNVGLPAWTNYFGGLAGSDSTPQAVVVDAAGNVVVTGASKGNTSGMDYATIKYSSQGIGLWTNRFNGPANGDDLPTAVAVDANGNIFVTGSTPGTGDAPDFLTVAYSGSGVPLWTNQFNGTGNYDDRPVDIAVDSNGNVFVTGTSTTLFAGQNYLTIKYSNSGVPLWTNVYGGPANYDFPVDMALDSNGSVLVTGYSQAAGIGAPYDYATVKYSNSGIPLWTNRYNSPDNSGAQASAIAVDSIGNVFVTGSSRDNISFDDYTTIKYSSAGVAVWTNRYGAPANSSDFPLAMAAAPNGNVAVTGYGNFGTSYNYVTILYSGPGTALWTNQYHTAGNDDEAQSMAMDANGRVYVTGYSTPGTSTDFATIAYSPAGTALWTNTYNGPADSTDMPMSPRSLALGANGSVIVIGRSEGIHFGGRNDYAVIAYSTAPSLTIQRTTTNTVALSWPSPWTSYHLQQNTNNVTSVNWSNAPGTLQDNGTNKTVVISPPTGSRFYRLLSP